MDAKTLYDELVKDMEANTAAKASKMFGMPCLKNEKGKALAGYSNHKVTFKLPPETVHAWLKQEGVIPFDPGMGRPMKEWIQLPAAYASHRPQLAREALDYVYTKGK